MDIVPCDNKRYRYAYHRSSWLVAGKADPTPPHRYFIHQDGPFTVEQLNASNHLVSFDKVKLTNNELDATGQVTENLDILSLFSAINNVYFIRIDVNPMRNGSIFLDYTQFDA